MSLEEFHRNFRSDLQTIISERVEAGEGPFPSEELVFAEMVMDHVAETGICETPTVCHWSGMIGNAKLRITGYALSSDETALDLFVTHYFGSEELTELKDADATATASEGVRFLIRAATGNLETRIDPTHPVRDLVATIRSRWGGLDRLRVFVITDGRTKTKRFSNKEVQQKMVAVEAMDIERLFRHTEGKPRDELAVSFVQSMGHPLPCVHVPDPDADYEYALTAIPGQLIRDLYLRFGSRLLEANVRTFLGTKKPTNKGIIETLKTEPEHFLAFNNGLVLVCDEAAFERTSEGNLGLSFIKGLQIVNGGQTTSTLYFASRDDRTIDLSHVMVPAKIIILKGAEDDARERLISNVSRYANSQNAVKLSDLSANRPFHVQLEKLANETWCPDGATRWFYERAAGAYNVMLLREGTTQARRRKLKEMISPKRKLTKNDLAKYHEAWRGKPNQVAMAGEKNFKAFMDALDEEPAIVPNPLDSRWYRLMISKVILFKEIESMIKTKEAKEVFRQGWVNIATYVVSIVSDRIGERLDLEQIWMKQGISAGMRDLLWDWAVVVNSEFNRIAPGQQFSEVAKRADTWAKVKVADYPTPPRDIAELKPT
ncbi:AIPR protein [Rhizobium leguminosarum]|uniref:AIPR family protein n=1 Tax=Rhizobium TaxID=379 RepID=UPI0005230872|nr:MULTISPECIES: AIPR family protein [Rhizobium]KPN26108.1 AIPR protein [Rhizobium brockwellii]MBY5314359.1 AIPR family protein [Rhizobium leguminosarum]NEH53465.1 AIPR protein [Rhizobium leguminosarum]QJX04084.1 AIPR family protein [Rhizobium brockwellii]